MIALSKYITGGRATFTLVSKKTEERFTFKVTKKKETGVCFVRAKIGQSYRYLGVIFCDGNYAHGKKSDIHQGALVARAWEWFWKHKESPQVEFLPSGQCCCCGRKLTTPESIALGIGPECARKHL